MRSLHWRDPRSWIFLAACLAAGSLLFFLDPARSHVFPPCPLHFLTGLHCPGCGSLRAFHQILHGNLGAAFGLNPLMVLMLPFLGILWLKPAWSRHLWTAWSLLGVLLAYGVLRNLPFGPFPMLAPH